MPAAKPRPAEAESKARLSPCGRAELEITILNRQRRLSASIPRLRRVLTDAALALSARHRAMTLVLAGDRLVRSLNSRYRAKDRTTDVLAFCADHGGVDLGDVVISVETAARQARVQGHAVQKELEILALHGLLHLLGYDHETDDGSMRRLERSLRRRIFRPRAAIRRRSAFRK